MCSEDVFDLLGDFPLHLKTEPLDDLFSIEPKPILNKKLFETPPPLFSIDEEERKSSPKPHSPAISYEAEQTKCSPKTPAPTFSYPEDQTPVSLKIPSTSPTYDDEWVYDDERFEGSPKRNAVSEPPRNKFKSESSFPQRTRSDASPKSCTTTEDDSALVGGPSVNVKASKLHPYEDFYSFLIREGGIERERLAKYVSSQEYPRPDEDFVSFLARSIGIKDEQYVNSLRQALRCESVKLKQPQVPIKMEVDEAKLEVRPDEDARSFLVRSGSWEATSSIDEELASAGLGKDEDAESFLRRTGNLSDVSLEFESLKEMQFLQPGMSSFITAKQELEALKEQVLTQVSSPSESFQEEVSSPSTSGDMEGVVVNRKRRLSDWE